MTRDRANRLLDAVKTGKQSTRLSRVGIREALRATGDLPPPSVRAPVQRRQPNFGSTR
jgi:hypothetical protein